MAKKRIVLMYISETSGHHSATIAIEHALKRLSSNIEVLNINAFRYTNPISEKIVNSLYMGIIKRTPSLWDYLYDNPSIVKKVEKIKEAIHKFNSPKLKRLFDRFKPDVIACTQAFPCGMVADYKKTYRVHTPLVAILTDYIPHSYWLYDTIDYYITPSDEVSQRLVKKGGKPEKILAYGIPFNHAFSEHIEEDKILQKLKFSGHVPTILIMGGGQGLGPIKTIVTSLEKVTGELQEVIVTGTNKKLYRQLKKKIKKFKKKIALFGYVSTINEFMSVSDIIISKPGGITTAEALSKRLPLIIVKPIPGQEISNTQYLTERKAAIKLDDPKKIHTVIEELCLHPEKLSALRDAAGSIGKPNASLDIAQFLIDQAQGHSVQN